MLTFQMLFLSPILLGVILGFVSVINGATEDKTKDVGTVVGIDLGTTYSWWVILEKYAKYT